MSGLEPSFEKVFSNIDVAPALAELAANGHLWGEQAMRLGAASPHRESTDIWLRYRDVEEYTRRFGDDMSHFCDEHDSVWLPPAQLLPAAQWIAMTVGTACNRPLGGVLLTKVPAGARIAPHIDYGWHAAVHDKFYIALQLAQGAKFCWEDGHIDAEAGDVWRFRNDVLHWVENPTDTDRISMIVCVRKESWN